MLSYCHSKWRNGWRPGKSLSLDEETVGCTGRCAIATRIKGKAEADSGFQFDAICDDAYTITFHGRCDVLPCTQEKDVSPRDTRCAWLVEQLPGAWYHLWMDNLYTSWKFGQMLAARQCLFGGTLRNEAWRGHHLEIVQKTETKVAELEKAKGTLLASARAEGIPQGCEVICTSYYDDSPFMMMSNIVEGVDVIEFYRKCYSTGTQKHFWVCIKRLSLADLYNHNMNQVDLADQLRTWYRPDGLWTRQKKWWWNIFLWCMGQAVVNAYVMYKVVCQEEGKRPMTHLEFHVAVAAAWCKTPKLVLEYEKPSHAEMRAAADAAAPEQGGVRGAREHARRAAAQAAAPASAPRKEPVRRRTTSPFQSPKMTDAKHAAAEKSYQESPELHRIEIPALTKKEAVSNCQMCGTGRGMRKPGERFQTTAHLRCGHCNVHVCGAGCWQLLHGYYDKSPGMGEVLPARVPKVHTDDEGEGEE